MLLYIEFFLHRGTSSPEPLTRSLAGAQGPAPLAWLARCARSRRSLIHTSVMLLLLSVVSAPCRAPRERESYNAAAPTQSRRARSPECAPPPPPPAPPPPAPPLPHPSVP